MRILAASDLHGDRELVKALAKKAKKEEVDLVVIAGDLTFWEQNLEGLVGPFKDVKKKVLIIPGNHETVATTDFLSKLYQPNTYNLHGYSMTFDSVGFLGCGGATIGLFKVDDNTVFETLKRVNESIKEIEKKVMVVHMPPHNTKLDIIGEYNTGSEGVRRAIEEIKPSLCICGHIHETGGLEDKIGNTRIINAATSKGVIIDI